MAADAVHVGKMSEKRGNHMEYRAAVITMSDKGSQGLREDTAGDAVVKILEENG